MNPNPERAEPSWAPVVVASAFQTGMLLMRNLERRGVRACCVDHNLGNPGFRSVYGRNHACPNPDTHPNEWARFMIDLAATFDRKPVLIPAADVFISAMARHAEKLAQHYTFFTATIQLQAQLCVKDSLYEIAARHGFPLPLTRHVTNEAELAGFAAAAQYPCLMKPQQGRMWQSLPLKHPCFSEKLARVSSKEDLIALYKSLVAFTPNVVVQEEIAGPDSAKLVYLSCYSHLGDRLGYALLRELRTAAPIHFGNASIVEPTVDTETEALCDGFLRKLGYQGLCEIELKRDSRDGKVKMIEANPRYSGTSDAAPYDGVDIGWLHYLDLIGQSVSPVNPKIGDFRHVMFAGDLGSMRDYVARGLETWGFIAMSYRSPVYFFDVDPRDWRNFARTLVRIGRIIGGIVYRSLFRKRKNHKL